MHYNLKYTAFEGNYMAAPPDGVLNLVESQPHGGPNDRGIELK